MTCSSPECSLPVDEAGLCFAHKAAAIADALCVVAAKRKAVSVTVGGASVTMHPDGFDYGDVTGEAPRVEMREASGVEHEPSVRELVNESPVDEGTLFAASEGTVPTEDT